MSLRRDLLRAIYPAYRRLMSSTTKAAIYSNKNMVVPHELFYPLAAQLNNGTDLQFKTLRGKKVLIVNTASDCGYTAQYAELEQLASRHPNDLIVIGFPSNDFGEQEQGSDWDIAAFCERNYGISFPLATKSQVVGKNANPVFQWLSDSGKNGWNDQPPVWNFSKYLINENGILTHYFGPAVTPATIEKLVFSVG